MPWSCELIVGPTEGRSCSSIPLAVSLSFVGVVPFGGYFPPVVAVAIVIVVVVVVVVDVASDQLPLSQEATYLLLRLSKNLTVKKTASSTSVVTKV